VNQKAIKLSAMEEAKAYFDDAIKLLNTMPETDGNRARRISLLVNQIDVFKLLYKLPEYHDLLTRYEPMAMKLDNPGLLGAFYANMANCEWASENPGKAIQTAAKGAELCEASGNAEGAAQAYETLQYTHLLHNDNFDKAIALTEDVLRKMEQQFNLRLCVWAFCGASLAYGRLGRWDEAREEGKKGLRLAEEYSDNSMISFAAWTVSWSYLFKGDLDQAIEYGDLGVQKAPTPADKMWAQTILAWVWCRAGEPKRGSETLAAILPIMQAGRFIPFEITLMPMLGEGYWLAGEYDNARDTLEKLLELAGRCEYRYFIGWAQRLLGEIAIETNPAEAAPHFEKSIAVLRKIKAENELALAYSGYGRFHKQHGNIAEAREYLNKALEIFERLGTLLEPDKVRKELGELPKE
jgi:tetratricopeptide (TPR) repeat protein